MTKIDGLNNTQIAAVITLMVIALALNVGSIVAITWGALMLYAAGPAFWPLFWVIGGSLWLVWVVVSSVKRGG